MNDAFDPYHKWLGILPAEQPPHHYRLLGIALYESDPDVIENAADQRMSHLRGFQNGRSAVLSQRLLNEVSAAKVCLLNAEKKAAYDAQLGHKLAASGLNAGTTNAALIDELREIAAPPPTAQPVFTPPLPPQTPPRRNAGRRLVPAVGGAVALLVAVALAAAFLSGGGPPGGETADDAAGEAIDDTVDDVIDESPAAERADGGGSPDEPAAPRPEEMLASIRAAREAGGVRRTALACGRNAGSPVEDVPAADGLLVGMTLTFGRVRTSGVVVMTSVAGIYRTSDGIATGRTFGRRYRTKHRVVARPGYAVGAIDVKGHRRVNGIRVVFMRVEGTRLAPEDSYVSDWMGGSGLSDDVRLGGDGSPVIGLYGRQGAYIDALGLVQAVTVTR